MKTVKQKEINELCEKARIDAMEEYAVFVGDWHRLRYCTAEVFETKTFTFCAHTQLLLLALTSAKTPAMTFFALHTVTRPRPRSISQNFAMTT